MSGKHDERWTISCLVVLGLRPHLSKLFSDAGITAARTHNGDTFLQERGAPQWGDDGTRGHGLHIHVRHPVPTKAQEVRKFKEIFPEQHDSGMPGGEKCCSEGSF